jgi:3-oxoacyl-[acyl-carrier-protein] synthase II
MRGGEMMAEGSGLFNRRKWVRGGAEVFRGTRGGAMRRVIVTGMGCITPHGVGVGPYWEALTAGRSGIGPLTAFDPSGHACRIAGEAREFEPLDHLSQREASASARAVQLGLGAARMAVEDSRLAISRVDATRIGVFVGSSVGTFDYAAENHAIFLEKGIRRVHPLFPAQSYSGVVATQLAISLGIRGPALAVSTACNSSTDAIGLGWMYVRSGVVDRAIVGGTEAPLTPLLFASFDRLGVMSRENERPERASRPFSADRDGFVLSEGAGVCILEAEEVAVARGARALAEVVGYAATSDAFHSFSPHPSGEDGTRAIRLALEAAGARLSDVDYINGHAIGSRPNDPIEADILKATFGEGIQRIPVSAIKSMTGHTMGAAGALELIATICSIRDSLLPPTINLQPDEAVAGLDLVPAVARSCPVRLAISTTFGFGSRNGVLAVTPSDIAT